MFSGNATISLISEVEVIVQGHSLRSNVEV